MEKTKLESIALLSALPLYFELVS